MENPDQAQTILAPVQASDSDKALAWEAFHGSRDENELATKLNSMGLPDSVKAGLWEAKRQQKVHTVGPGVTAPPQTGSAPISYAAPIQSSIFGNILKGFGNSALQTLNGGRAGSYAPMTDIPISLEQQQALDSVRNDFYNQLQPQGTAQKVGGGLEQAAELLAPTSAAEGLLAKLAGRSNFITKAGAGGLIAGLDAIPHNQDPRTSALIGAGGGALSSILSALAAKTTGAALNTSPQQAKIVLSELTGITPKSISQQAATKSLGLTRQMEQMATDADTQFAAANQTSAPQARDAAAGESAVDEATRRGPGIAPAQNAANTYSRPGSTQQSIIDMLNAAKSGNGSTAAMSRVDAHKVAKAAIGNTVIDSASPESAALPAAPNEPSTPAANLQQAASSNDFTASQGQAGGIASTRPALDVLDREMQKAITQNNQPYYDQLGKIKNQLTTEFATGDPIGQAVPAKKILDLKRGIGGLINSWDAPARNQTRSVIKEVYGALDSELDKAAPGISDVNDMIHNLIGVKTAAAKTAKQTSGAAFLNSMRRGEYGAIATRPLSSPTAFVAGARAVNSPVTQSGIKGLALQLANYPQLQQALSDANALPPENQ